MMQTKTVKVANKEQKRNERRLFPGIAGSFSLRMNEKKKK